MLENRPIVVFTIGYIIGIIMGLYFKISIVFFHICFYLIYLVISTKKSTRKFKLISIKRYSRYLKIFITQKVILIIFISSIISNSIVLYQNQKHKNLYTKFDNQSIKIEGTIISNCNEDEYKNSYKLKVKSVNDEKNYYKTNLLINVEKDKEFLNYGQNVVIQGNFEIPSENKNYKGFNYRNYLKTAKIYGIVEVEKLEKSNYQDLDIIPAFLKQTNQIFLNIRQLVKSNFKDDVSDMVLGLTIGYTKEMSEELSQSIQNINISHIFAVSGMHVILIIAFLKTFFEKTFGKRKSKIIIIVFLILYMFITGLSPSIVRACITASIAILGPIFVRKSDVWENLMLSLLIMLLYNPFLIENVGLLLSYFATLGILIFQKSLAKIIKIKNDKIKENIVLTISATIGIIPILAIFFNTIPITSIITGMIIGVIISPLTILCLIFIFFGIILNIFNLNNLEFFISLKKIFINMLTLIIDIVIDLIKIGEKIPLSKIYVKTPSYFEVIIYFSAMIIMNFIINIYTTKRLNPTQKRVKNLIHLIKFRINQNSKRFLSTILILSLILVFINIIPKCLKFYFIDVGQGDSTLIVTPYEKTILIDGGGSEFGDFDVGEKVLIPYLLDRKIKKIDYIIISHFDSDHIGGILSVLQNLKVEKIIIGKQFETTENHKKFIEIATEKKIELNIIEAGQKIYIEKNLYIEILWPDEVRKISENSINNNSLVFKLRYKDFSILFTGDIEEIAEKEILKKYKDNLEILNSTVLKVAHHGSKTSSITEFIEAVNPSISLIGVGENNKYGHPNEIVLENLKNIQCSIFRTDIHGEIMIKTNGKKYKIKKYVNNN